MWISGLEAVQRKLGLQRVIDLSATPFFLRGSGYAEGTLFPWTASDFSLMDAIESGIVKLPRGAGGRQHPRRRHAEVSEPVGAHPGEDAEARSRQGGQARSAQPAGRAPDRVGSALRTLREDVRAVGEGGHRGSAVLHRRLQQHVDLEAGLRLHLRLPPRERGRLHHGGERPPGPLPQLRRRVPQPAGPPAHAAHRQRAARLGRGSGQELPERRRRRDRSLPAGDRGPAPATGGRPSNCPTRICSARS